MASFHDRYVFSSKIDKAMKVVEKILSNTRNPRIASVDHDHTYDDKFSLSEFLSKIALASLLNTLEKLGLDKTALRHLVDAASEHKQSVTLRFDSKERCEFIKEETIDVVDPQHTSVEKKYVGGTDGDSITITSTEILSSITEYHWKRDVECSVYVYVGNDFQADGDNSNMLTKSNPSCEIITRGSKKAPFPSTLVNEPLDVSLTWVLQRLNRENLTVEFEINRNESSCRTPRHNDETSDAWTHFGEISKWCASVNSYLIRKESLDARWNGLEDKPTSKNVSLSTIKGNDIFVPVLPIFESLQDTGAGPSSPSPLLTMKDVNVFLAEQCRTMSEQITVISSQFSPCSEAVILLLNTHIISISKFWKDGIQHIESMLCKQLFDAIGKSVDCKDLNEFVRFNNQRLFLDTYAPEPFCYAIRRPNHYPDGIISIEDKFENQISTFTRKLENRENRYPMHIPISSATSVEFKGDLYLHAWILQKFGSKPSSFVLTSRARQFSCFLLLIGKLSGSDTFEPAHGIILQNKDEILIPLLLEEMPSPKEFKDAIASLSPQQQQFAQMFRNMKLSSSVFGLCVVQLKPQLEVLLGLPDKSLTKEIQLTQDLLSLFIDFQVPSDLLSYDGPCEVDISEKVKVVKGHVKDVNDMIEGAKEKELTNANMIKNMNKTTASSFGSPITLDDDGFLYKNTDESIPKFSPEIEAYFGSCGGNTYAPAPSGADINAQNSKREIALHTMRRSAATAGRGRAGGSGPRFRKEQPNNKVNAALCADLAAINQTQQPDAYAVQVKAKSAPSSANFTSNEHDGQWREVSDSLKVSNDLTNIPKVLDTQFEKMDDMERYAGSLKSSIIEVGDNWRKKSKLNILSSLKESILETKEQKEEKDKAFDLLDALSRSGSLPIACAELHVMVASTHCFKKSVMNTVVEDNINPIEKIERSNLLVASVIHGVKAVELLQDKKKIHSISQNAPYLLTEQDVLL